MSNLRPCVGCAACCHLQVELVMGTDDIPERLTYFDNNRWYMRQNGNACIALDETKGCCTIYENRPIVCRQFPRGKRDCYMSIYRVYGVEAVELCM